jgi:hypothetical protein
MKIHETNKNFENENKRNESRAIINEHLPKMHTHDRP